jgi:hypothetical protein
LGVIVLTYNPALGRMRQEDHKLQASLVYRARLCLRKAKISKKKIKLKR